MFYFRLTELQVNTVKSDSQCSECKSAQALLEHLTPGGGSGGGGGGAAVSGIAPLEPEDVWFGLESENWDAS